MIIGAQLFTLRDFTQTIKDFEATMQKIAEIGYTTAQLSAAGAIGEKNARACAEKYGIDIVVTHTNPERILHDTSYVIEEHKVLGANYVGIGSMPMRYRSSKAAGFEQFVADFTPAARTIKEAGMRLVYHNHAFEFELFGGKLGMDIILEGLEDAQFLPDTFWIQAGGADVVQYLRKYAGRIDCVHFKDYGIKNNERIMAPVMEGNLNWPAIFDACKESGVKWAFVEQDDCYGENPFDCMKRSYDNLKKVLG